MHLIARIANFQLMLAMACLVIMGLVTVCDVFLKYFFTRPIVGAYDLVETLLPIVVFYGLPSALIRRQNIVIDLIDHFVGPQRTRKLVTGSDVLTAALLILIASAMITPALQAFAYGDRKLELGLPLAVIWAVTLVGMVGCIIVGLGLVFNLPQISRKTG